MKRMLTAGAAALLVSGAAWAQDVLLIVNKGEDTLSIIDPADYSEIARLPTGANPHEVAVSPDGNIAYVSDYGGAQGSTLTVVDLETNSVTATWSTEGNIGPHGIWVSDDGDRVWATTETTQSVVELDTASGEVTNSWSTDARGSHQLTPSLDDRFLYVADIGEGTLTAIDRELDVVNAIEVGGGPEALDVSPDGSEIWVGLRDDHEIAVIDAATGEITDRFASGGQMPIRLKFTTDGARVYVSNAVSGAVAVFDAESRELITTIDVGAVPVGILMAPDGSRVFVANTMDDFITVIDPDALDVSGRVTAGDEPDGMAWAVRD